MNNFNRKEFLKLSIYSLSFLMNCSTESDKNKKYLNLLVNSSKKIIILGAGISGITCARALKERGYENITILEARNRVGGRINSLSYKGSALDLGATWIHGYENNPITPIAKKLNLGLFPTDDNSVMALQEGIGSLPEVLVDGYEAAYENILELAQNIRLPNKSRKEVIQTINSGFFENPIFLSMYSAGEEFDIGGDGSEISSVYFDTDGSFRGGDVVIPKGYSSIIDYLKNGIDIRLNQVVSSVNRVGNGFKVISNGEPNMSDIVVCALPLGVLKSGNVIFSPEISTSKKNAIQKIGVGTVNKVILEYPNVFWDETKQYINYFSSTRGNFSYLINLKTYSPFNMLCGITTGNYSAEMDSKSDMYNKNQMHSILKSMYGNSIPDPINYFVTHWSTDPFSLGSYSFPKVGSEPFQYEELGKTEPPNLFFCGEHTNEAYRGTVHGAYLSGLRVADEIKNSIF
jgi:monoamine oxidase